MPRLTNQRYVQRHRLLHEIWLKHKSRFSYLSPTQQWDLYAYYRPSENLSRAELLKHRREITRTQPTLPHKASKAFKALIVGRSAEGVTLSAGKRQVRVRSIVYPQPDIEKLARALLALADQLAKQERDDERKAA